MLFIFVMRQKASMKKIESENLHKIKAINYEKLYFKKRKLKIIFVAVKLEKLHVNCFIVRNSKGSNFDLFSCTRVRKELS